MQKSKLILLLSSLNKKEMTRFFEFSCSPYHNKHADVMAFCSYSNKIYPHFTEKKCNRKLLFKQIFGCQAFDQAKLNLVFTYASKLFELFMVYEELKNKPQTQWLLLLEKYRNKRYYVQFEKRLNLAQKELEKQSIQNSQFYQFQFQLAKEADEFYTLQSKHQKDQSLQSKQDSLDIFFISEKLKDACEAFMRNKLLKVEYDLKFINAVVATIQQQIKKYSEIPSVIIYFQIYKMLTENKSEYYYELIPILNKYIHYFTMVEKKSIYDYAQNFCINKINLGESEFLLEVFNLYQKQMENDLLLEDGYLLEWHYKNIVSTGLRLKKYDWTKKFLEDQKKQLNPASLQNAYRYNLAAYSYEIGDYSRVLELLVKLDFTDVRYNLGAKSILVRTYFDLSEYEALSSHCHAFKVFLNRHKLLSDYRKKGFGNLIKFADKIAKTKSEKPYSNDLVYEKQISKIKKDLEETDPVFNKAWLLEKI